MPRPWCARCLSSPEPVPWTDLNNYYIWPTNSCSIPILGRYFPGCTNSFIVLFLGYYFFAPTNSCSVRYLGHYFFGRIIRVVFAFPLRFSGPVGAAVHPDYRGSPPGLLASSPTGRLSSKRRKSQKEGRCLGDPRVIPAKPLY